MCHGWFRKQWEPAFFIGLEILLDLDDFILAGRTAL